MLRLATRPLDDSPRDLQQRAHTNASSSFALRHLPLLMSNLWQSSLYAHHTVSAPGHSSPLSCPSPSGSRTQQEPRRVSVAPSELENREKKALNQNQLNKTRMHSSRMRTVCCSGHPCWGEGVSACHTPLWTEWQTRVKTLPYRYYVADGNQLHLRAAKHRVPTFFIPSNSLIFPWLFPDFLRVFPDFFLVFTKIF